MVCASNRGKRGRAPTICRSKATTTDKRRRRLALPASRLSPLRVAAKRAIQTNSSITPRRQNVKKRRNTAYYGLVMGINTWTEKQNSGSAGLYSIPRRLLYRDHGGGKLSRVRQHRESGLPLMGCCRSDRSRKAAGINTNLPALRVQFL